MTSRTKRSKHTHSFHCHRCILSFQTFGPPRGRTHGGVYCPACGEYDEVRVQRGMHGQREEMKNLKIRWKPEELEILELCIQGKLTNYQVAVKIGRSVNSVSKRLKRAKAERTKLLGDLGPEK